MEEAIKIVEAKLASITQENNYFAMGARSALQEILVQLQAAQQSVQLTNGGQANFEGDSNTAIRSKRKPLGAGA